MKRARRKIKFNATGYAMVTTNDKDEIVEVEDIEVEDFDNVEIVW